MEIVTIETASLGDRSYVVHDGSVAAVIDPQRDIDRVMAVLDERGLELKAVFETHVHNDYVTGGFELARRTGASYHLHGAERMTFAFTPLADGDVVAVGALRVRALHTPGHTPTHLSYVVADGARDIAVFTGGSLLYGSVGRSDLIAAERTEELTRLQYRSARRLADELPGDVEVRPTHGFGSFCSSGATSGRGESTLAIERRTNQALTIDDEDAFVRLIVAGLDDHPAYYAHMGPINREGPGDIDLSPAALVDTTELLRRIHAGEWVVDLRTRRSFARDHLTGTINIGLEDHASTYLGWTIPWGTPVTLIADTAADIAAMQRQLVRIGIDRPAGRFPGGVAALDPAAPRGRYEVSDFAGLREAIDAGRDLAVLDARLRLEWQEGHLPGAMHIPLHELARRMDELADTEIWVHCASGYRASIAASLLSRAGRRVVLIDDEFTEAAAHFAPADTSARA